MEKFVITSYSIHYTKLYEIADFVHQELHCPVLINAGNWKTADSILLNDSELV